MFRAIDRSDIFLFAVSRASLASIECRKEFERARDEHKRIIPVVLDGTQPSAAPPDLASIGWIPAAAAERIDKAIRTDLEHLERHTRFLLAALDWKNNRGGLLRGASLREAQEWLANAGDKEPAPATEHRELVDASLGAERRRRIAAAITSSLILIVIVLLATVVRDRTRLARASTLAADSEQLWKTRQIDQAMLRAVKAYRTAPSRDATRALVDAVQNTETLMVWSFANGVLTKRRTRTFDSGITALAAHASTIVAGLTSGSVIRIDADHLEEFGHAQPHTASVLALTFEATGRSLASAGADRRVQITRSSGAPSAFELHGRVFTAAFDPASTRLGVAGADAAIYILDVAHRQPLARVVRRERGAIKQLRFDAQGNVVASGQDVALTQTLPGGPKLEMVMDVVASPQGDRLVVADNTGTIAMWSVSPARFVRAWKTPEAVADLAFSAGGKRLASVNSANGTITLIAVNETEIETFKGECSRVFSVAFLDKHLVTGCDDGSLELLDLNERKSIVRMSDQEDGLADFVNVLAVRGHQVAAGTDDGRVLLWNLDPEWWMRRACRRANRDVAPCNAISGRPAEIPSGIPPPDNQAIPDGPAPQSIVARMTPAAARRTPRRRSLSART